MEFQDKILVGVDKEFYVNEEVYDDFVVEKESIQQISEKEISPFMFLRTKENEDAILKFEQFNRGEISKKEYGEWIWKTIERFVRKRALECYNGNLQDLEDAIQDAATETMKILERYNPYKSAPVTYFGEFVAPVITKRFKPEARFYRVYKDCERVAIECGYSGVNDPKITIQFLHIQTGYPIPTIKNAFRVCNTSLVSLDKPNAEGDTLANLIPASHSESPEAIAIRNELREMILEHLGKLTTFERWLFLKYNVDEISFNVIIKAINGMSRDEFYERFGEEKLKPSQQNLQRIINDAKRKMQRTGLRNVYEERKDESLEEIYQAEDEDIALAFATGDL